MVREISHFLMIVKLSSALRLWLGGFSTPGRPLFQHAFTMSGQAGNSHMEVIPGPRVQRIRAQAGTENQNQPPVQRPKSRKIRDRVGGKCKWAIKGTEADRVNFESEESPEINSFQPPAAQALFPGVSPAPGSCNVAVPWSPHLAWEVSSIPYQCNLPPSTMPSSLWPNPPHSAWMPLLSPYRRNHCISPKLISPKTLVFATELT